MARGPAIAPGCQSGRGSIPWREAERGAHAREDLARVLGLSPLQIHSRYPIQEVSTGLPFVLVPLNGLSYVSRAALDAAAYEDYFRGAPKPIYLFCRKAFHPSRQVHARMFAPVGRPSLLHIEARRFIAGGMEIRVGGKVVEVAEGRLAAEAADSSSRRG